MVSSSCIARLLVMAAEDQQSPMLVHIDSAGGLASEALRILSTMDGIRAPVATFCHGAIGGAAAVIAAHGLKGYRAASPDSVFSFRFDAETRKREDRESHERLLVEVVARDTKQSEDKVREWFSNGTEFTPEQARANGLVDLVAEDAVLPSVRKA